MIGRRALLRAAPAAVLAGCGRAPPDPPAPPPVVETSGAHPALPALGAALAAFATATRSAQRVPSVSVAAVLPDGSAAAAACGWADPEAPRPATPATRYMSGSTGKMVCAALALSFVQDGRITLDQKIAPLFADEPWFAHLPNHEALTLSLLLRHAAGFPQFLDLNAFRAAYLTDTVLGHDVGYSPRRMLGFIADAAPLNAPGAAFAYSDLHFDLVALTLEKLSGRHYFDLIRERILARLPGAEIGVNAGPRLPGLAAGYAHAGWLEALLGLAGRVTRADGTLRQNPVLEFAGGGLNTTPRALALFLRALFTGGIVSPDMVRAMTETTIAVPGAPPGVDLAYGLGVFVTRRPGFGTYLNHSGFYPGYVTNCAYFRASGLAVAIQTNSDAADIFTPLRDLARAAASASGLRLG